MVRYVPVALLLALGLAAGAAAQSAVAPVVVVNDAAVTNYDVEQRARLLVVNGAAQDARLGEIALDQLIDDRLKRAASGRAAVDPGALDAAVADYAAARGMSGAQLDAALARAGVARAALEAALSADLLWRDAVRARFGARAEPSEAEIDQEFALGAGGRVREYRLGEIGLPTAARGEAATLALAERLLRELNAGGDFAAAARANSASPSATRGGEIGWTLESALPPALAEALADAPDGAVIGPVPIGGGVALLKLHERRVTEAGAGGTVSVLAIRARTDRRAEARAQIARLLEGDPGCDAAEAAGRAAGLGVERSPQAPASALPAPVQNAIAGRAVGQSTEAFATDDGAVGFVVCARGDEADPAARDAIRQRLRSQRLQRFASSWLQELRADAVIERR